MFGRNRNRVAKAESGGLDHIRIRRGALGFIRKQHHRLAAFAQSAGDIAVCGS